MEIFPDSKKNLFDDISQKDIEEFLDLVEKGIGTDKPSNRLEKMTLNTFLDACALGYRYNYNDDPSLTPKQLYKKYADGRDDGLLRIEGDDPEAFENWDPYSDENFNGHHPWEVCRGWSFSRIHLYPSKDENGYYFSVSGDSYGRCVETIKFFLAIHRAGYPIMIYDAKKIAQRFIGNDKIGIVPRGVSTWYPELNFPGENIIDCVNFRYDEDKDLLPFITWQEIEKVELK